MIITSSPSDSRKLHAVSCDLTKIRNGIITGHLFSEEAIFSSISANELEELEFPEERERSKPNA